jgi:mannose/cellobiose epimerase-like protein (N-acyl-D-glucosamine 2-epimerase family)
LASRRQSGAGFKVENGASFAIPGLELVLDIPSLAERVRSWIVHDALPLWTRLGLDLHHGGVIECFKPDLSAPGQTEFKRLRVACRQLYVFSHASVLGWPARAAADHVYAHLQQAFWLGAETGWARRLTTTGAVLDPTPDLYDYAFVLFALAWRYRATRESTALSSAHLTLDMIEQRFRHPLFAGYENALPATLPRQQNPHMHLMEAALALIEATGERRFHALADQLFALFANHLFDARAGLLREFFAPDWSLAPGDEGRRVEPGHMFEWTWILHQYQRLTGTDATAPMQSLTAFAERHGVDPKTQLTVNAVRDDGAVLDRGSRVWPNTERIKAWIALSEATGKDATPALAGSVNVLFDRYLTPARPGAWIDLIDEDGRPHSPTIPTSTLYHIFLAFAELLRFSGRSTL